MLHNSQQSLRTIIVIVMATMFSTSILTGAQIEVRLLNNDLAPAEPLIIDVALQLSATSTTTATASQPYTNNRNLHRRLEARVFKDDNIVSKFPLYGPDLMPNHDNSDVYRSKYIGIISQRNPQSSDYLYYDVEGEYMLSICDPADSDLPSSAGVPFRIRKLEGKELAGC